MKDYTPLQKRLLGTVAPDIRSLSRKACVDESVLCSLLKGTYKSRPTLATWHKIAKVARCTVDELIELYHLTYPELTENRTGPNPN